MTFVDPNPLAGDANGAAGKPRQNSREEGTADVVDVPQADGNSKPAEVVKPADKVVTTAGAPERE